MTGQNKSTRITVMPPPPVELGIDHWLLSISREEIETADVVPAILELGPLLTPENVQRFRRRVSLFVLGYDDDPRELYQIEEVRAWLMKIDLAFPFWFYFLSLDPRSSLRWVTLGLCRNQVVAGKLEIDLDHLSQFVNFRLYSMAQLCAVHGIGPDETQRLAREIKEFYDP